MLETCFVCLYPTLKFEIRGRTINHTINSEQERIVIRVQVDIPKGYSPDQKVSFTKGFHSEAEGSLVRKFLSRRFIIPKTFIPKGRYSEIRNKPCQIPRARSPALIDGGGEGYAKSENLCFLLNHAMPHFRRVISMGIVINCNKSHQVTVASGVPTIFFL